MYAGVIAAAATSPRPINAAQESGRTLWLAGATQGSSLQKAIEEKNLAGKTSDTSLITAPVQVRKARRVISTPTWNRKLPTAANWSFKETFPQKWAKKNPLQNKLYRMKWLSFHPIKLTFISSYYVQHKLKKQSGKALNVHFFMMSIFCLASLALELWG